MASMRDVFLNEIYKYAKENYDVLIVSADFSAPALDQFRLALPNQYVFTGISEQNMMLVAAGLALEGKKPFCYAIAPFITLRCFEQTRNYAAGMDLPITLVGVGAGISYEDSGYTHHAVEDVSLFRTLPHMKIIQPCDNIDTVTAAKIAMKSMHPMYVRLDRYGVDSFYKHETDLSDIGVYWVIPKKPVSIMAAGRMVKTAINVADKLAENGIQVGVVNASILPIDEKSFINEMKGVSTLITLEEHNLQGGFGSHVLELVSDNDLSIKVKRLGMDLSNGFVEFFGGRDFIHKKYGIDVENVIDVIRKEMRD